LTWDHGELLISAVIFFYFLMHTVYETFEEFFEGHLK